MGCTLTRLQLRISFAKSMVVLYDAEASFCALVMHRKGSVFPIVLRQPLFWFLLVVHCGLLYLDRMILVADPGARTIHRGLVARPRRRSAHDHPRVPQI